MRVSLITLSVFLLTSCGGIGTGGHPNFYKSGSFGQGLTSGSPDGFSCPSGNNIRPNFDFWLDGSGYFKACASDSDPASLFLSGNPSASNFIFVYPVEFITPTNIQVKDNPITPEPDILSQLVSNFSEDGQIITFTGITYNALFIVDFANKDQMDICLAAQDYFFCPPYSYGKFK